MKRDLCAPANRNQQSTAENSDSNCLGKTAHECTSLSFGSPLLVTSPSTGRRVDFMGLIQPSLQRVTFPEKACPCIHATTFKVYTESWDVRRFPGIQVWTNGSDWNIVWIDEVSNPDAYPRRRTASPFRSFRPLLLYDRVSTQSEIRPNFGNCGCFIRSFFLGDWFDKATTSTPQKAYKVNEPNHFRFPPKVNALFSALGNCRWLDWEKPKFL